MSVDWIYLEPVLHKGKLMFKDQNGRFLAGQISASVERESYSSGTVFNIQLTPKNESGGLVNIQLSGSELKAEQTKDLVNAVNQQLSEEQK